MTFIGQSRILSLGLCQPSINIPFPACKGMQIIHMPELLQEGNFTKYIDIFHVCETQDLCEDLL